MSALSRPAAYPDNPADVELRQTHISYLFFTPNLVYKIKKPVNFGFLDFTTLEKRRFFCHQEITLNRRMTNDVYLDVVPISIGKNGITVSGEGKTIEYAVKMRRLPEERMLSTMILEGTVSEDIIEGIGRFIASSHKKAVSNETISSYGRPEAIGNSTEENFKQTERFIGRTISKKQFDRISSYTREVLARRKRLFSERVGHSFIRDLHGDIHSEHICVTDGIQIFDCIEFNERFRFIDVVSDMAFLAMDLDFYNRNDLSKDFSDTYFKSSGDEAGKRLFDFYSSYRAYVRGKVESLKSEEAEVPDGEKMGSLIRARRYFHLAYQYATGGISPFIVVVCGLAGTGKTTVAKGLSTAFGLPSISSDIIRKELAGIPLQEHRLEYFEEGIYSRAFTERTYNRLIDEASAYLRNDRSVVVDATFSRKRHMEAIISKASGTGATVHIVQCTAPEGTVERRLREREERGNTVSDGRWAIYLDQRKTYEEPKEPHLTVDTSKPLEEIVLQLLGEIFG